MGVSFLENNSVFCHWKLEEYLQNKKKIFLQTPHENQFVTDSLLAKQICLINKKC